MARRWAPQTRYTLRRNRASILKNLILDMLFQQDAAGKFIWPGFGENCRVLKWIFNRTDVPPRSLDMAEESAVGMLPSSNGIDLTGLDNIADMDKLLAVSRAFWLNEVKEIRKFFNEQVNEDLPPVIAIELNALEKRVQDM